jgi:integrase
VRWSRLHKIEPARKHGRYGHRDATMILLAYRHGLRASEVCDLQWHQIELATGRLHVRRAKNGSPSVHSMQSDEICALRRLQREQGPSSHVFMTERDGPMTPKAFHALFGRIGARPSCNSRYIHTCCDTAVAMPWRTRATTRGRYRHQIYPKDLWALPGHPEPAVSLAQRVPRGAIWAVHEIARAERL